MSIQKKRLTLVASQRLEKAEAIEETGVEGGDSDLILFYEIAI
ncbi:MAG: hypothetical protein DDT18_01650 [Actinobacteria bacterium]|nr:hypothetical protein [Actinomycetota bacterium]